MASVGLDRIAPRAGNRWDPEIGDVISGEVGFVGTSIKDDFDRKGKEMSLRIDFIQPDGEIITWYCTMQTSVDPDTGEPKKDSYPKRDARAVADAVQKAGFTDIETGGRLAVKRLPDTPTDRGAPAKNWVAEYEGPKPGATKVGMPIPEPESAPLIAQTIVQAPGPFDQPTAQPTTNDPREQEAALVALSAATGMPVALLATMTPEQIALLPRVTLLSDQHPAPAPANPLGGLLAPRP